MISFIQAIIQAESVSLRLDKLGRQAGSADKSTCYTDLTTLVRVPEPTWEERKDSHKFPSHFHIDSIECIHIHIHTS